MKKLTAMQDLREDLQLAIESANNALNDIIDEKTREHCQLVVKITIGNILIRIDNELLKLEKEQIIDACDYGDFEELGEQYYSETFNQAKS